VTVGNPRLCQLICSAHCTGKLPPTPVHDSLTTNILHLLMTIHTVEYPDTCRRLAPPTANDGRQWIVTRLYRVSDTSFTRSSWATDNRTFSTPIHPRDLLLDRFRNPFPLRLLLQFRLYNPPWRMLTSAKLDKRKFNDPNIPFVDGGSSRHDNTSPPTSCHSMADPLRCS